MCLIKQLESSYPGVSECCHCQKTIIQNRISKLFQFFPFLVKHLERTPLFKMSLALSPTPFPHTHCCSSNSPRLSRKSPPLEDSLLSSLLSLPFSLNSGLQKVKRTVQQDQTLLKPDKRAKQAKPECSLEGTGTK